MKHINNTEEFNINGDMKRIINDIEISIDNMIEHPEDYVKYDQKLLWEKLLKDAKENNYRGNITIKTIEKSNKKMIVYYPKKSFLQTLGSAAANARRS